ncbi:hypothetical protein B5P43_13520 [Bacillus sp. SRB_336]|nr:hypothetical protein B5P43_13520 [Bacillus sp. SRB_336]
MVSVPAQWSGMFRVDTDSDGAQRFLRLNPSGYLPPSTDGLANRAAMPAGVRASWRTGSGILTLAGDGAPDSAHYDVLVNGERTHQLPAAGEHRHAVPLDPLAPESQVEVWLPHFGDFRLKTATFDGVGTVAAAESGPRWLTYGSSITHCQQADGPTQTWPALVARRNGWRLFNLGMAGECQLDPVAADTIAHTPLDLISLCVGINSYNAATFSERTYAGAVHGFIATVRRAHPDVPVVVITPVLSLPREDKPNAVGWTLADYRRATADVVALLQRGGDARIHLIDGAAMLTAREAFERLPDTLHPDTGGYALMADRLGPQLASALRC